eukprot:289215_1
MHQFVKMALLNPRNDTSDLKQKFHATSKDANPSQTSHRLIMDHTQKVLLPVLPPSGYCLMFKRKTKYCKLSISNEDNRLEIMITEKCNDTNEHEQGASPHFEQHHSYLMDLFSLQQRFQQPTCNINDVAFYSRDGQYIYMILSMYAPNVEEWAEKLENHVEIDPLKAIRKGRQDPSFQLAHRTYCPSLDDVQDTDDIPCAPHQCIIQDLFKETVILNKLSMQKWENIHIGFSKYVGNIYVENKIPERLYLRILFDVLTRTKGNFDVEQLLRLGEHPLCGFFALSGYDPPLKKYNHMYNVRRHHGDHHMDHNENDHGKIFNIFTKWDDILEDIRLYYGEANGFYFAFVLHYTKWLCYLSVIGVIWFLAQCIADDIAITGSLIFSFVAVCWATVCHEDWKRREWELRYKWGMLKVNIAEIPKPLSDGMFIISEMDGEVLQIFGNRWKRYGRLLASFSSILLCIACVVSAVFGIWILKSKWGTSTMHAVSIGILNAVQIHIFNLLYTKLAIKLNDWEEHRKRSHEYDALVVKRILFIMVNSFNSLFYLALYASYPSNKVRLVAIRTQLITLFATAIVIQNFFEIVLPAIKTWVKRKLFEYEAKLFELDDLDIQIVTDWEEQSQLVCRTIDYKEYDEEDEKRSESSHDHRLDKDGIIRRNKQILRDIELQSEQSESPDVLDNTAEIVVLHGYIIIFAIIFPIMPLLGILNNYFELRIDFYNLLHSQRPCPRASNGIGIWKNVMSVINTIAIFSNFGLLAFRTHDISTVYLHSHNIRHIVEFFFATSAVTWLIKQAVKMIIPDKSFEVKAAIARQKICEKHLLLNKIKKLLKRQAHKKGD